MADRGYPIVVDAAIDGDAGFIAYAPDLPGCLGDGDTREAAIADLQLAIEEWIDEAHACSRAVPQPGSAKERFQQERTEVEKLVAAQHQLIGAQEKLISEQKVEIDRARSRLTHFLEADDQPAHGYWLGVHVSAVVAKKKNRSLPN